MSIAPFEPEMYSSIDDAKEPVSSEPEAAPEDISETILAEEITQAAEGGEILPDDEMPVETSDAFTSLVDFILRNQLIVLSVLIAIIIYQSIK
jgi:hypothetical protein